MTEMFTHAQAISQLRSALKRAAAYVALAALGVLFVATAAAALVATTVIGVLLAVAALSLAAAHTLHLRRGRPAPARAPASAASQTLEARYTADGWVIEKPSLR